VLAGVSMLCAWKCCGHVCVVGIGVVWTRVWLSRLVIYSPKTSIISLLNEAVWAIFLRPPMALVSNRGILTGSLVIWWLIGLASARAAFWTADGPVALGGLTSVLGAAAASVTSAPRRCGGRKSETGDRGPGRAFVRGAGRWPGLGATGAAYTSEKMGSCSLSAV